MKARSILTTMSMMFVLLGIANAEPLFTDDFEAGLSDGWIVGHLSGQSQWEVVDLDGNSVLRVDSTGGGWTGATMDAVASLGVHDELWATCKFMAEQSIESCSELGLLTSPDTLNGNWYLATAEGGAEIGIDECAVVWHNRVSYPWELDRWYNIKIMVSKDGVMSGKMWLVDDDEPEDWNTQETLGTHLDEDGVGLMSYNCISYFDDVIVASSEDSLAMAVSPKEKLAITWGMVKSVAK